MGRLLLGLLLLAGAAVVAGDVAGHWTARDALSTGWPVVIVAVGVAQLVFQPRPWLVTALVVGMGGLLLLQQVEAMPIGALWLTLLLVVGDGAWLLMAQVIQTRSSHAHQVGPTALLRPERTAVDADRFTGGRVADVLGGVTLDLRDAEPAPGGAEVIATSILGSVEVIAPPDWETRVSGIPVLGVVTGGTPARGSPEGMPARTAAPDLVVKGRTLLGVVEVRASE